MAGQFSESLTKSDRTLNRFERFLIWDDGNDRTGHISPVPGSDGRTQRPYKTSVALFIRGRVYNAFLHEPFFVDSLNRAVLGKNRSIKTVSETFLSHFIDNVNYLAT